MKRLIEICTICIFTLILAGCGFPSQRIYKVESCDSVIKCGNKLPLNSEFAFVKETKGKNWKIWRNIGGNLSELPGCEGPVIKDGFSCGACGPDGTFTITKAASSECSFNHCVHFHYEGGSCPNPGDGKGGHN